MYGYGTFLPSYTLRRTCREIRAAQVLCWTQTHRSRKLQNIALVLWKPGVCTQSGGHGATWDFAFVLTTQVKAPKDMNARRAIKHCILEPHSRSRSEWLSHLHTSILLGHMRLTISYTLYEYTQVSKRRVKNREMICFAFAKVLTTVGLFCTRNPVHYNFECRFHFRSRRGSQSRPHYEHYVSPDETSFMHSHAQHVIAYYSISFRATYSTISKAQAQAATVYRSLV